MKNRSKIKIAAQVRPNPSDEDIAFIKELRSSAIYTLNLRKILILLLRLLFIISLILMFARPVTRGFIPGWFAAEQDASLVIIIDNSASMTATRNGKSYLNISKNEVMALLPSFKKETQVVISQTCPPKIVFPLRVIIVIPKISSPGLGSVTFLSFSIEAA